MISIFRELEESTLRKELSKERNEFLQDIREYIFSGKWTKHKDQAERVLTILRYGYKKTSEMLGITESGVRLIIMRASIAIRDSIGSNLIQLVVEGSDEDFETAKTQFMLAKQEFKLENLFQTDIYHVLELLDKPSRHYTLGELSNELKYLRSRTRYALSLDLDFLNDDKLSFILTALASSSPMYSSVRMPIYKKLIF